ncbi:hypothetical protein H4S01_002169 [Coemansia sp. RSA 2610]|nr:hypothetical protein H4S01_002169 [Coemansia sp. RSA 2610]
MTEIGASRAENSVLGTPRSALRRPLSTAGSALGASLLYGAAAEEKVVLELGTSTIRAGFSGDPQPLCAHDVSGDFTSTGAMGWRRGTQHGLSTVTLDDATLDALVLEQVRDVYRRHLLVDAKARKVALCESVRLPDRVRRAVARVLLGNLRVPQVTFYPAEVAALMTCGRTSGLVVDCGHQGAAVVPVYDGRALHAYAERLRVGGQMLAAHVRGLCVQHARFRAFGGGDSRPAEPEMITDSLLEHMVRRLQCAAPLATAPDEFAKLARDGLSLGAVSDELAARFASHTVGASAHIRMVVDSPQHGRGELLVPRWVLGRATELLLQGDAANDHEGLLSAIARCLARAPVDTRRELIAHILVVGGVASVPGFRFRLAQELQSRLAGEERWRALAASVALAEEPGPWNQSPYLDPEARPESRDKSANGSVFAAADRCWVGVSLAVAAKIGGVDMRRDDFDGHSLPRLD